MKKLLIALAMGIAAVSSAAAEDDTRIDHAMSAAPPAIGADATIMLLDGTVLREGSNGWTCFPSLGDEDPDPMCGDAAWTAYMRTDPDGMKLEIGDTGVAYMLASDMPHMMIVVPEAGGYEGLNTEPGDGKAWVMWGERAGRHVMIPIGTASE